MFLIFAIALGAAVGTVVTKKQNNKDNDEPGRPEEP
jgi:hypothetical protein